MMTREDMLRELELLPVWQLRKPEAIKVQAQRPVEAEVLITATTLAQQKMITFIVSENGNWLFVLDAPLQSDEEAQLLRNIFKAMHLQMQAEKSQQLMPDFLSKLQANYPIKCIVTMGETATQAILQTDEILEKLRGKLHSVAGVKLAPTYDIRHLLQALPDKAKTWHDLCLAMQALQEVNANI